MNLYGQAEVFMDYSIKEEISKYSGESETYALNDAIGFLFPL